MERARDTRASLQELLLVCTTLVVHFCPMVSFCMAPLRLLGLAEELIARAKWYRNLCHEAFNKTLVENKESGHCRRLACDACLAILPSCAPQLQLLSPQLEVGAVDTSMDSCIEASFLRFSGSNSVDLVVWVSFMLCCFFFRVLVI